MTRFKDNCLALFYHSPGNSQEILRQRVKNDGKNRLQRFLYIGKMLSKNTGLCIIIKIKNKEERFMQTQFFWGIIAGAVIVLVAFLIPAVLQITRTAKAAEEFLKTTLASLTPLIAKLNETVDKTNQVAAKLDQSISDVQHLTKAVGETGAIIGDINSFIRKIQTLLLVSTSSFGTGIKTALSVLAQGLIKKGG